MIEQDEQWLCAIDPLLRNVDTLSQCPEDKTTKQIKS